MTVRMSARPSFVMTGNQVQHVVLMLHLLFYVPMRFPGSRSPYPFVPPFCRHTIHLFCLSRQTVFMCDGFCHTLFFNMHCCQMDAGAKHGREEQIR